MAKQKSAHSQTKWGEKVKVQQSEERKTQGEEVGSPKRKEKERSILLMGNGYLSRLLREGCGGVRGRGFVSYLMNRAK